jgi:hypothetical protein
MKRQPRPEREQPINEAKVPVTEDEIAVRAYELYVARGQADGYDLDDWLFAERELRGQESGSR